MHMQIESLQPNAHGAPSTFLGIASYAISPNSSISHFPPPGLPPALLLLVNSGVVRVRVEHGQDDMAELPEAATGVVAYDLLHDGRQGHVPCVHSGGNRIESVGPSNVTGHK